MKKINQLFSKGLYFSLFVYSGSLMSQLDHKVESKFKSENSQIFKRFDYKSDNPKVSELDILIDSVLKSFMQSPPTCGISIGVTLNSKTFFYNYGEIKRESKILADSNTIYEIGSITNIYTAFLLAQAVRENKLSLEDEIKKYLPGSYPNLNYAKKNIRIKHLASHSSGLPNVPLNFMSQLNYEALNPYKSYTKEMLLTSLKTIKLNDVPGYQFVYSSLGIALLGLILEEVYHCQIEQLLNEKIAQTYRLTNTSYTLSQSQLLNLATGYNDEGLETPHWDMDVFKSTGGIKSTCYDMLTWLNLNRLENNEEFNLTQTPVYNGKETVGLAWFIKKTKQGNQLIWHNGATFGSSGFCGFIKEKECSVVILSNSERNVDFLGIAILNYLQK